METHEKCVRVTSDGLIFKGWVLLKLLTGIWRHKLSFFFVKERGETCISICLPQATSLLQVYTFYYDIHQ